MPSHSDRVRRNYKGECLHDAAMRIAYDDAQEWQTHSRGVPDGYKANLLAQRIEELVERFTKCS